VCREGFVPCLSLSTTVVDRRAINSFHVIKFFSFFFLIYLLVMKLLSYFSSFISALAYEVDEQQLNGADDKFWVDRQQSKI
jgi:hypothetical protein